MRTFMRAVVLKCKLRKSEIGRDDLSPIKYDLKAINNRVHRAMLRTGHTRAELAEVFGMDASIPLALQPAEKIPRPTMEAIVKVSQFFGISVRWILYGEIENEIDFFVESQPMQSVNSASSVQGSAVVQGNEQSTIIVKNIQGEFLNEQERETLNAFRKLCARDQVAVMSYIFSIEGKSAGKEVNNPKFE